MSYFISDPFACVGRPIFVLVLRGSCTQGFSLGLDRTPLGARQEPETQEGI